MLLEALGDVGASDERIIANVDVNGFMAAEEHQGYKFLPFPKI
jgi:hypothetical protein